MTRTTCLLLGLIGCITLPGMAAAQNPQPAAPHETQVPVAPPSASQPPPEQIAPSGGTTGSSGTANLSGRLSKQQGMLRPPAVDPGIQAQVPSHDTGTMPVIPPPGGTPGGNPTVVPK